MALQVVRENVKDLFLVILVVKDQIEVRQK